MNKLYVCGDSFASLVHNQEQGKSWSEIVATKQSLVLENLARPAASNVAIAMQIDYLLPELTAKDTVIILLTDHYRLTVATAPVTYSNQLLTQMLPHEQQLAHTAYQGNNLVSVNITNPKWQRYFEHGYDPVLQNYIEYNVVQSAINRLHHATDNYIIISGGWARRLAVPKASAELFQVPESNFLNCTQEAMLALNNSTQQDYINHLDNMAHAKLANTILMKLRSTNE